MHLFRLTVLDPWGKELRSDTKGTAGNNFLLETLRVQSLRRILPTVHLGHSLFSSVRQNSARTYRTGNKVSLLKSTKLPKDDYRYLLEISDDQDCEDFVGKVQDPGPALLEYLESYPPLRVHLLEFCETSRTRKDRRHGFETQPRSRGN